MKKNAFLFVVTILMGSAAFAEEATTAAAETTVAAATTTAASMGGALGLIGLGIGLLMGLAVMGGALGQAKAANAALDGIARNPSAAKNIQTNLIIALALMESLVLFAFVISFFLQGAVVKALG